MKNFPVLFLLFYCGLIQAQDSNSKILRFHEVKPIFQETVDSQGKKIEEVREVSILFQLPREVFARREIIPLTQNLLLDPRVVQGKKTYSVIVEPDGSFTPLPPEQK